MSRHTHKWEELFMAEFFEELARCPLAYFTSAPIEDHGSHNALAVDMVPMYELALALAERIGGIVFPQVPFGQGGAPALTRDQIRAKPALYPPSMIVSCELCRQIYEEVFEGMARIGFKACVTLGGHGPEITALAAFGREHGGAVGGMRLLTLHWPELLKPTPLFQECIRRWPRAMAHSGIIETALMMHLRPEQVDLSRTFDVLTAPYASQTTKYMRDGKDPDSDRHLRDLQEHATPALGKALFDELLRVIDAVIRAGLGECVPVSPGP